MKYPEIYYPYFYRRIAECKPEIEKPIEPLKPLHPKEPDKVEGKSGCLFVPVIVIILLFIISDFINFKIIASSIGLSLLSIFMYMLGNKDKELYRQKIESYKKEKREYPQQMRFYELQVLKYQEEIIAYEKKLEKVLNKKNLKKHRNNQYSKLYKEKSLGFEWCTKDDDVRTGIAEDFFYDYLDQIEGLTVFQETKISVGKTYYYPDFLAIVNSHGFYIDIEIDEPYEMKNGLPIHYKWCDNNRYDEFIDFDRNEYFTDKGWFVIRFAEEQVVRNPVECVEFVQDFIKKVTSFSMRQPKMEFEIKKWTEDEAEDLAKKEYRLEYLNEIEKLDTSLCNKDYFKEIILDNFSLKDLESGVLAGNIFDEFYVIISDDHGLNRISSYPYVIDEKDINFKNFIFIENEITYDFFDINLFMKDYNSDTILINEVAVLWTNNELGMKKGVTVLRAELI